MARYGKILILAFGNLVGYIHYMFPAAGLRGAGAGVGHCKYVMVLAGDLNRRNNLLLPLPW